MATNGGNIVVPVGVQLELNNVQEVISILQKALSNIKPDTSAFKGISKIITEMTREMERLQVQSSKGFSSQKQFEQANQTVDKLEESLIRAQLAMQNLKFSDLKLNPMQENAFKGFEKELELIEQKLNNVKEKVKQDIFNNDISKSQLSIIDPKGLSKSFDEIDKLINQRAQTVKGEIDGYKAQLSLLNEAINKGNTAQKLLTEGITGDIFGGKYTYTNANGILGFKPGTAKSEFLKALKDEFSLSEADLDQLRNLTFGKMSELFKSMGQGNQKNIFEQWIKNLVGDTSQSNVLNEKVKKLEEVQNAVLALQQKIQDAKASGTPLSIALEQNQGDIARVAAAIQQYQNSALGAVNSNQKLNDSFNSMKSQLTTFISQLNAASTEFLRLQSQQQTFNSIKMAITNFMGFTQVLNLTKNAVKEAMNHIKQLDTTMNAIAIVSEMTTEDLWKQVDAYSEVAQKYGTTIQGAYEVSKIYYQAGYETSEVMTLMNETLKLSKVSGLDYAKTTDYMMTATRGFHMEISEAASVVDVYSALAANTAVSQKELAEAMSKTASSMEGVGASFQQASAMIATMVAVTRESSQNIGSSLKSIASRYGELTKDPAKLIDSEGAEMSFNKVDEALQSVGISLQTADHQFRDLTDVILELTDVWDKLDSTQQRYIATQFAGNRQQSRFLALVSNGDLLRENIEVAEDSEDTGTLQTLKSLDSIESKLNQVQVAYQQFYTSIGAESAWKIALDGIRNFIDSLNNLPKVFEKIPLGAATVVIDAISIIRSIGLQGISLIAQNFKNILHSEFQQTKTDIGNETRQIGEQAKEGLKEGFEQNQNNVTITLFDKIKEDAAEKAEEIKNAFQILSSDWGEALKNGLSAGNFDLFKEDLNYIIDYLTQMGYISPIEAENLRNLVPEEVLVRLGQLGQKAEQSSEKVNLLTQTAINASKNFSNIGAALNIVANALDKSSNSGRIFSGVLMGISGGLRLTGEIIKGFSQGLSAISWITVAMGIISIINGISTAIETSEEKLERLNKEAEQLTNTAKQIKSDEKTLQKSIDKVEELKIKRYESAEAAEEYQQAVEDLADKFPELIMGFDEAGNVIVDLQSAEETLAAARQKTLQATYDAAVAEQKAQQQQIDNAKEKIKNFNNSYFGSGYEGLDFLRKNDESSIKENINKILMSKDYNNLISENLSSGQMNLKDLFEPENLKQLALTIQTNFLKDLDAGAAQSVQTLTDIENMIKNSIFSQNEELQQLLENLKQAQENPEEAANNSAADTMAAFITQLDNIDFNTEEGQKQYEDFIKAYNTLDEKVKDYFNQNIFNVDDLINQIEVIVTSSSQLKGVNRSLIDNYLKLVKVNEEGWDFLEQNNNAALLLTNELTKIWSQENNKDLSWDDFKNSEDFKNGIEEFYDAYDKLGEDRQKILKELEIDTRSYTANDVKEMLGTSKEEDNPINSYIDNLFKSAEESKKQFEEIFDNLKVAKDSNLSDGLSVSLRDLESGLKEINESLVFSPEALAFIDSQAKQISKLNNDGFIKAAQKMADQTVELMRVLYEDSMSPQERSTALSIINNANLQTKEGFDEAIDQIKKSTIDSADQDALIEQLTKQKQEIIDNVILSLNADLASITEQTENDSKLLSKVTSGLTIKETNELIQSAKGWGLDLTLQDFIPDGDKLIASEEAFIQIQQKYKDKIEKAKEKAEEDLSKAKEIGLYDGESFTDIPNQLTEEQLEFINKQIKGFSEDSENFEGENLSKIGKEKIKEMYKGIEDALFNYGSSVANLFNTVFSEQKWNKGDYSSLMSDPRFVIKNPLKNLFPKFDDIFNSEEFNKYLTGEQKYTINEPQIKKAVEKARSGVDKFLSDLLNKGIDKFNPADYANEGIEKSTYNQMVEDLKNFGNNYVDFIKKYADLTGKTESEIDSLIAQAYNKQNENNAYDALKDIVGSFDQISFEAGQKIVRSIEGFELEDFDTDPITGSLQLSYEKALELLNEGIKDKTSKEYNELRAQIEKRQTDLSTSKILSNIIQNRSKLSEENIAAMANIFKTSYEIIERSLIKNNDGTYTIGLDKIQEMIDKAQLVLGHSVSELFSNEIDAIIKSITGITSDQSKGFTDLSSMQKYVKGLRDKGVKLNGKDLNFDQLFEYNESLRAYQLTTQGVIAQIAAGKHEIDNLKDRLKNSTSSTEQKDLLEQIAIGETFIQDTIKGFADAIDFESLINATNGNEYNQARENINQAIEDYNAAKAALVGDGAKFVAINAQALIQAIGGGGANAVAAAQKIAEIRGKTLSDDTVEKLYRKQVNNFIEAIDKVGAQAGEIVDSTTGALISMSGGKVSILEGTGSAVVESAANLYEAYNNLLQRMAATGEATLADLNKVAALALENRKTGDSKASEQYIIDALGDAANMTYTRFGELLTSAGYRLSEELINSWDKLGIIKDFGGSKLAITDFSKFADIMGWEAGSEQYTSAFKTYNDSMIQMNRQVERNILEEAQNVASAQGGDWVNITQLTSKMQETYEKVLESPTAQTSSIINPLTALNEKLKDYGAYIEDGILKIGETADIPAIMQAVAQAAAESGGLLSNEMAQLADTVADAIKSYADLISGGIEGSLTNTQAEQLQDWANKNGVGQLDFTPTEKGLKVATDQAQKLVAALKNVDSIQGKLTFDKLIEAMSTDKGGKFSNISKTTAEIAKLQREIVANEEKIKAIEETTGGTLAQKKAAAIEEQNAKLREQISIYREIQEAQSMDPSQYNFMDRDLPTQLEGPINYWNSVGKAFAAMNESSKTGKMAIQDFYNIVSEMENLANISGTSFQLAGYQIGGEASQAADLITAGLGKLTNIDGKGVKVNLEGLSLDFSSGADKAKENFAEGVHALAESQVAMLKAAIQVLEIVVAMEEIGQVDVEGNKNGIIDLSEIFGEGLKFDEAKGFDKNYTEAVDALLTKADGDKELKDALEKVKVNGNSMYDMLDAARGTVDEQARKWKELNMSEQQYQAVINGFYQALMNGDYNLDSIQSSVWEILDQVMPDGTTIDVGDRTIVISGGTHTQINWKSESVQEILKAFEKKVEDPEKEIIKSVERYNSGKGKQVDALITLAINGKIKITYNDKAGSFEIEGPNGEKIDPSSDKGKEIIAKSALENVGLKPGEVIEDKEGNTIGVESTVQVGKKTLKVFASGKGTVYYHSERLGRDFTSIDELIHAEYMDLVKQELEKSGGKPINLPPEDVWAYQEYGIRNNIKTSFIDENGTKIEDPSNDPIFRKSLSDLLTKSQQSISDFINQNLTKVEDGKYQLTLPGWGTIEIEAPDDESAKAELEAKIRELYAPMADSVQQGIVAAFTSTGEDGKTNAVQQAITTAITNAFGGGVGADGQPIQVNPVTVQPTGLTVDLTQAGEPTLSNGEDSQDIKIGEVTLKPEKVKLNLEDYSPSTDNTSEKVTEVPINEISVKPNNVKLNLDGYSPSTENTENVKKEITEVPIGEVTLKPNKVGLNLNDYKPVIDEKSKATEVPTGEVVLKPSKIIADTKEVKPEEIDSIDASVSKLNITEVKSSSMGGSGLINKAASALFGNKPLEIPTADGVIGTLNVTGVTNPVDFTTAINSATSSETGVTIDSVDAALTNLKITSLTNPADFSTITKSANATSTGVTISSVEAALTNLKVTSLTNAADFSAIVSSAGSNGITIPNMNATVTDLKADATKVDVSSLEEKIKSALEKIDFKISVTPEVKSGSGGEDDGQGPDLSGITSLNEAINDLSSKASTAAQVVKEIADASTKADSKEIVAASTATKEAKSAEMSNAMHAINNTKAEKVVTATGAINNVNATPATNARNAINDIKSAPAIAAKNAINGISSAGAINAKNAINGISAPSSLSTSMTLSVKSKGNMPGVAKAKGSNLAMASGTRKTLMGELGPELVVSNGRYFLAGENGAEFVDLADDAIVFNHLQTRRLFEQGAIGGRGKAFTNERNAVAFAKGKFSNNGPAVAPANPTKPKNIPDGGTGTPNAEPKKFKKTVAGSLHKISGTINWYKGKFTKTSDSSTSKNLKQMEFDVEPGQTKTLNANVHPIQWLSNLKTGTHKTGSGSNSKNLGTYTAAKGNIPTTGPAKSSASAALALLKQLLAMWESLANASMADMGGMPGGSGGGGGGGGKKDETSKYVAGIVSDVERWYNWLRLIEATQNKINILTKEYDVLVAKGAGTKEIADNLREQAKNYQVLLSATQQLAEEQTKYRNETYIPEANKGLFGAFYTADPKTGQIYVANDSAFLNYIKNGNNGLTEAEKKAAIENIQKGSGKGELTATYTTEQNKIIGQKIYDSRKKSINKDDYKSLSDYEKQFYTQDGDKYKLKTATEIGAALTKPQTSSVKILRKGGIKSGLDFMDELFGQLDEAGNNKHDAKEQLALIKAMGFYSDDLLTGVDTEQEGWEKQVVENFKKKIEADRTQIESLNKSIQDQNEKALEYKKQIQEINNKLIEMTRPVQGITEHLERWYNYSQKIVSLQHKLNLLTAKYNQLQNQTGNNDKKLLENLKQQGEETKKKLEQTEKETEGKREDFRDIAKKHGLTLSAAKAKSKNEQTWISNEDYNKLSEEDKARYTYSKRKKRWKLIKKYQEGDLDYTKTTANGIYKLDEYGNLVYNDRKESISKTEYEGLSNFGKQFYKRNGKGYKLISTAKKRAPLQNVAGKNYENQIDSDKYEALSDDEKNFYKKNKNGTYTLKKKYQNIINQRGNKATFLVTQKKPVMTKDKETGEEYYVKEAGNFSNILDLQESYSAKKDIPKEDRKYYKKVKVNGKTKYVLKDEYASIYKNEGITKELRDSQEERMNKEEGKMKDYEKYKDLNDTISKEDFNKLSKEEQTKMKEYYRYDKKTKTWKITNTAKQGRKIYQTHNEAYSAAKAIVDAYDDGLAKTIEEKGLVNLDVSDPEKFFKELTATDSKGNSIYDATTQAEVLVQAGLGEAMQYVNGTKYFDSLETASQKDLEKAAAAYLEYIKQNPEEWAKAKKALEDNVETEEELKTKISEINNQIEEMLKWTPGVVKDFETWADLAREIELSQQRLNKLAAEYNKIIKLSGTTNAQKLQNLMKRADEYAKSIEDNKKITAEKQVDAENEAKNLNEGVYGQFYQADSKTGKVTKRTDGLENFDINSDRTVTIDVQDRDEKDYERRNINGEAKTIAEAFNGKTYDELTDEEKKLWDTSIRATAQKTIEIPNDVFENGVLNQTKFIKWLTSKDVNNNSVFSGDEQTALLAKAGILQKLGRFNNEEYFANYDEAHSDDLNRATQDFLESFDTATDAFTEAYDAWKDSETEGENLKTNLYDINDQMSELTKTIPGITTNIDKWYNTLKRIDALTSNIGKIETKISLAQKDRQANGAGIYALMVEEAEYLQSSKQTKNEEKIGLEQDRARAVSLYRDMPITYNEKTGVATFDETPLNKTIAIDYLREKRNADGYKVDTEGNYYKNGVLYDKNGNEVKGKEFGVQATERITGTIDTGGLSFPKLLEELGTKSPTGEYIYDAQTVFEVIRGLGLERFMQYDASGNKLFDDFSELSPEEMQAAVNAGIARMQGAVDGINGYTEKINAIDKDNLNIDSKLLDLQNTLIDNQIEVQNLVKDAVKQEHQDLIDEKKDLTEAIDDAASKTIEGMRNSLEKERKKAESDKDEKELSLLLMQLTAAEMSGSSTSTIRDLQEKIQDKQQEIYFNQQEALIDNFEEMTNDTVEALETQTDIMQKALDYQIEYGLIWEEVNKKMGDLSPDELSTYILNHSKDYFSKSELDRTNYSKEIKEKVALMYTNIKAIAAGKGINTEVDEDYLGDNPSPDSQTPLSETKIDSSSLGQSQLKSSLINIDNIIKYIQQQNEEIDKDEEQKQEFTQKEETKQDGLIIEGLTEKADSFVSDPPEINPLGSEELIIPSSSSDLTIGDSATEKQIKSSIPVSDPRVSEENPDLKFLDSETLVMPDSPEVFIDPGSTEAYEKEWKNIVKKNAPEGIYEQYLTMSQFLDKEHGADALRWYFNRWMNSHPDKNEVDFSKWLSQHWAGLKDWVWNNKKGEWINPPPYNTLKTIINQYRSHKRLGENKFENLSTKGTGKSIQERKYNMPAAGISSGKPANLNDPKSKIKKKYAQGGDIDYTGPAWVDGTKNKPEHIFNFEQMQTLRAHLLDGIDTTSRAVAGLSNIINSLPNVNTYNNISNNDSGVTIEHLEFHMEVQELSDNYSAREAAQATMDEIVRIARKSGMRSISRR